MTLDFSADVAEQGGFELIPKGTLAKCLITLRHGDNGVIHKSKNGKEMLSVELEILEGDFAGRKVWDYIVEPTTQGEWGWNKVKSILSVANANKPGERYSLSDYEQLSGMICAVEIGIQKGKDGYDDRNVVTAYLRNDPSSKTYDKYQKLVCGAAKPVSDDAVPF